MYYEVRSSTPQSSVGTFLLQLIWKMSNMNLLPDKRMVFEQLRNTTAAALPHSALSPMRNALLSTVSHKQPASFRALVFSH